MENAKLKCFEEWVSWVLTVFAMFFAVSVIICALLSAIALSSSAPWISIWLFRSIVSVLLFLAIEIIIYYTGKFVCFLTTQKPTATNQRGA